MSRRAWVPPTTVASSPMQRWRKPPTLAFAYISPARSSKRRMSIIFARTVSHVSLSGRSCLISPTWASLAASVCAAPLPSFGCLPALAFSLVAIGRQSTRCQFGSNRETPDWGVLHRPPALRPYAGALSSACGGLFEAIVAPEELVADGERRHAADAALVGLLGGLLEAVLGGLELDRLEHGVGVELAGGGGDQDVVDVPEIPAGVEGLAEGREREGDGAAGLLGEQGGAHGLERVGGPVGRPPDRQQPVLVRAPFDLAHAGVALVGDAPGAAARLLPDTAEQDRLPDRARPAAPDGDARRRARRRGSRGRSRRWAARRARVLTVRAPGLAPSASVSAAPARSRR